MKPTKNRTIRSMGSLGFTFAEVLAATALVAIVIPVAVQGLSVANRAGVVGDRMSMAADLTEAKLNELALTDTWRSSSTEGNYGEEWPGYRWVLEKESWEDATMRLLTVQTFFKAQGREYKVGLSTLVKDETQQ